MAGMVLRLAGPLQAWGEHSAFNERDTLRFPTRSGLIGMLAAAEGRTRDQSLDRYDDLRFTVRIDRPGVLISDYHTIGGGYPRERTVPTATGMRRPIEKATILSRRYYLSDAVFGVAVTGPDDLIEQLAAAIDQPRWQPYLGRRSCPPDQPVLLRAGKGDLQVDLRSEVPLPRAPERKGPTAVDFVVETDPQDPATTSTLQDVPRSFAPRNRRYGTRTVAVTSESVPAQLCIGNAAAYMHALHKYAQETR